MSDIGHDAAMDCIVGAAGVTVLSYEEAITAYFRLRGMMIPPSPARTAPEEGSHAAGGAVGGSEPSSSPVQEERG